MKRPAISTRAASIWQKLASAIAILAAVIFVTHAGAARGAVSYVHDHDLAHAGASLATSGATAKPRCGQEHSFSAGHTHDASDDVSLPCCGEACLLALVPDEEPPVDEPWGMPSRSLMVVSSLTGRVPEGLLRPPRLSQRI